MFGPLSLFLNLTDKVEVRPEAFESGSVEGFAVVGMSYVDDSLGAFL